MSVRSENLSSVKRWIVGITGASGTIYARRLLETLLEIDPLVEIDLVVSEAGLRVLREEEGFHTRVDRSELKSLIGIETPRVRMHRNRDIGASIASGSYPTEGMVVIPCSMSTLAAIASGYSQTLIHRAADVTLKEGRPLLLVPRETPLSPIHLENMLRLSKLGVKIIPAMPGFYHQPQSILELVDMMVMRVLDQMGFQSSLVKRWGVGESEGELWPLRKI